ncbi:MAG: PIN domain-containing protein [Acidimicrobiia bacterium]|nr:PIN domain-containing protein [Acidimicrobiia bacterium]
MSRLLLDTTFLVDAERDAASLELAVADDDDVAVAAISIAELGVGVRRATGKRRRARQAFLDDLVETVPVSPYDLTVAASHTELLVAVREAGRPRGAHDLVIAATARAAGRDVVSADPAGFEDLPGVALRPHR